MEVKRNSIKAFTLAEVLITLGIIGVVAAITIPTLMQSGDDRATVTGVKKAYSVLSQAYKLAINENGTPDTWGTVAGSNPEPFLFNIRSYLKITKSCDRATQGCFPAGVTYKYLNTNPDSVGVADSAAYPKLTLSDGMLVLAVPSTVVPMCTDSYGSLAILKNGCGQLFVDVNGFKGPNQHGKDYFDFYVTKDGVIPSGMVGDSLYPFTSFCQNSTSFGVGCASWVIQNNNVDYLKCTGLTWNSKTSCN